MANVTLTGQNTVDDYTLVEFDISWENSWRVVGGPGNWDAAWVFIKYRVGGGPWLHAWINDEGHTPPPGSTIEVGLLDPGSQFTSMDNPGMGVFIYRSSPGSGNFAITDAKLRWNYGDNGLSDNEQVDIKVFAIEHVYVPQGGFYLGSGGNEEGHFFTYDPTEILPYFIIGEAAIPVSTNSGDLYYNNTNGLSGDQMGPIPASFPKGYSAFYLMKYELSQQGYVDFLNTLDRGQQIGNVNSTIIGGGPYNVYVMTNTGTVFERNGIRMHSIIPSPPSSVTFYCDLNGNGVPNEANDGQHIACNFVSMSNVTSFLDWAALRPYTELEFEKAGRGMAEPVSWEFAWGTRNINFIQSLENSGTENEIPDLLANCNSNFSLSGPVRNGSFARMNSGRESAGSGHYGVLELSGNLWELVITVGSPEGRSFTPNHGNGILDATGFADVPTWPDQITAQGMGMRGGGYAVTDNSLRLSDRIYAAYNLPQPSGSFGLRGGRSVSP